MDNNPTNPQPEAPAPEAPAPAPESTPAPEQPAAPAPEQPETPTPAPEQPTPAPAPEPVQEKQPADAPLRGDPTVQVVDPITSGKPAVAEEVKKEQSKKTMKKLVPLFIGLGVLALLAVVIVVVYLISHNPENMVKSSINKLLRQDTLGINLQIDTDDGKYSSQTVKVNTLIDKNALYLRAENLAGLLEGSVANSIVDSLGEFTVRNIAREISDRWWKIDSTSSTSDEDSPVQIDVSSITDALNDRNKIIKAWNDHPFIYAVNQVSGSQYPTSGTVIRLGINEKEYEAFVEAVSDGKKVQNINSLDSDDELDEDVSSSTSLDLDSAKWTIDATISSSIFGDSTLTGLYLNKEENKIKTQVVVDLEHAAKTAPADSSNISEMITIIEKAILDLFSDSYSQDYSQLDYDDTLEIVDDEDDLSGSFSELEELMSQLEDLELEDYDY